MKKEKPAIFWVGLIILCLALVELFGIVWMLLVVMRPPNHIEFLKGIVPLIVGGVVFTFVGLYVMMQTAQRS